MTQQSPQNETHETNQSLWMLILSPIIWAVHFLACYITAAIWCAKYAGADGSLGKVPVAITVYTVLAVISIAMTGIWGLRRHRFGQSTSTHDFDTPEDRHRFLGFATFLLSALSAIATLYVALTVVFIHKCH